MLYERLKGRLNLVFITKKEFFKEVSLNGDLKDKEHLPMGRAGGKALQTKHSKGVGACKQKTRWQHAGRTVRSPQTPAAQDNHAGRLHIPSNSGEQTDGVTAQVSANFPILVWLKITHFYLYNCSNIFWLPPFISRVSFQSRREKCQLSPGYSSYSPNKTMNCCSWLIL